MSNDMRALPADPPAEPRPLPQDQPPDPQGELASLVRAADLLTRLLLVMAGAWTFWRTREWGWQGPWLWALGGYAGAVIVTVAREGRSVEGSRRWRWLACLSVVADALFACVLVGRDGGLGSPLYLLLFVVALKAVVAAQVWPGMAWLPFSFGPLYVAALWLASGHLAFLADPAFLARYLLMWVWLVGVALVTHVWTRRNTEAALAQREASRLRAALVEQQIALAQKTEILQRTATDLGDRVLELRSLQEVAKALASTLGLDETLQLIAERLRAVTGSSHCAVAVVEGEGATGATESGYLIGTLISDGAAAPQTFRLDVASEPATLEALRQDRMLRVVSSPEQGGTPLSWLLGGSYLIMPLKAHGRPLGALYLAEGNSELTDQPTEPGRGKTDQLVSSFAYFAATAIENSRLYQEAWEKRRELEAVLIGIGDGVVVVDPALNLILMNPVARRILDLVEEPPPGVPLKPYLTRPAFAELLEETLRGQRELIRELDLGPARGEETRTYGVLASPVLDTDGEVRGVVAVLRDITAQKELERMKSNFLSVVSHELRTPLHSIKGFVEIILMGKTGPVTALQQDFLQTVKTQTGVLQRMIDDLLEFSRMEAGKVKLHIAEVYLPAVAQAVAAKLAPLAEEAGLQLLVEVPEDLPEIAGDRVRLEQVLTNLVENGIKFTPAGGQVRISGGSLGDHVRLTVSDTGIGIPPEEQGKVFDRFYQVDGSERRAYRGAGLGLSICKHIVERHNGRIWVESDGVPGHGTRFHVELPIELHLDEEPTIDFTTSPGR